MTALYLLGIIHFIGGIVFTVMIHKIAKTRREIKNIQKYIKHEL